MSSFAALRGFNFVCIAAYRPCATERQKKEPIADMR